MILNILKKLKNLLYYCSEFIYLTILSANNKKDLNRNINKILKKNKKKNLNHWDKISNSVLKKISRFGFDNFLRIKEVKDTMFVSDESNFKKYLSLIDLKRDKKYLIENSFGNPKLSKIIKYTSINKLHQFHHIKFLSNYYKINSSRTFIEFGGGYGLFCSIVMNFYKPNKYIIFDLEGFNEIQKVYLKKILKKSEFSKIEFVSSYDNLKKRVQKIKKFNFFAFWSFSEVPIKDRIKFLFLIKKSSLFLIGFQNLFNFDNNKFYFKNLATQLIKFKIIKKKHPCYRENYYLLGKKIL